MIESLYAHPTSSGRAALRTGGFTLLELLVVLLILATLARTAILSVDGLVDQERRQSTARTITDVRDAILGRTNTLDASGHLWAEGFVSDIGRLPLTVAGDGLAFSELWQPSPTTAPFGLKVAPGDLEVRLPAGWRGPYLRLPLGRSALIDGWGRSFNALGLDGAPATVADPIGGIVSLGFDGEDGGEGYDEDLEQILSDTTFARHVGLVPVRVTPVTGGGAHIIVRIYGPIDGAVATLDQQSAPATIGDAPLLFLNIPIGHRIVRAYQFGPELPLTWEQPLPGAIASELVSIVVVSGGVPEISIDLGGG